MTKVLVLLADGFEEVEAITPIDYLRRVNVEVDMISTKDDLKVRGSHGIEIMANKTLDEIKDTITNYQAVIIPGGLPGATNLRDDKRVTDLAREFHEREKLVAAICAGPIVLHKAGILNNKKVTSYPGFEDDLVDAKYKNNIVVRDENIITARGPAVAVYFALEIVEYLKGNNNKNELKKSILLDLVEKEIVHK